jgi:plasmid replication initiation protein
VKSLVKNKYKGIKMADIIGSLNNRTVVRMSHELNFARFDLGIVALDIVYALIAQTSKEDEELNCYHISIVELERVLGRKLNRQSLKKAQQELLHELIVFSRDKDSSHAWCQVFELDSRLGIIKIQLHSALTKHLISLNVFVLGSLTEVLKLDSKYAKRIYFVASQFVSLGSFEIRVNALRYILKPPLSMEASHGNFKKRVLVPSVDNINALTSIRVSYNEVKMFKRVIDIEFVVYKPFVEKERKTKKSSKAGIAAVSDWLSSQVGNDMVIDAEVMPLLLSNTQ